jgi:cbb3-type cytochrome oxidase maturation protein
MLVIASIIVAAAFLVAFIWSVRSNQFEDQQGASMRMLYENEISNEKK